MSVMVDDEGARCAVCNVLIERVFAAGYGDGTCQHWVPPFNGPTRIYWTCCDACMVEFDENRDDYVTADGEAEVMDPNEALAQLRNYRWRVEMALDAGTTLDDLEGLARGLAEKVDALDNWLRNGGFYPDAWGGRKGGE